MSTLVKPPVNKTQIIEAAKNVAIATASSSVGLAEITDNANKDIVTILNEQGNSSIGSLAANSSSYGNKIKIAQYTTQHGVQVFPINLKEIRSLNYYSYSDTVLPAITITPGSFVITNGTLIQLRIQYATGNRKGNPRTSEAYVEATATGTANSTIDALVTAVNNNVKLKDEGLVASRSSGSLLLTATDIGYVPSVHIDRTFDNSAELRADIIAGSSDSPSISLNTPSASFGSKERVLSYLRENNPLDKSGIPGKSARFGDRLQLINSSATGFVVLHILEENELSNTNTYIAINQSFNTLLSTGTGTNNINTFISRLETASGVSVRRT